MSDNSELEIKKTALQTAAEIAQDVYKEGLQPSIKTLGATLDSIIKIIFHYPLVWGKYSAISMEEKAKKFEENVKKKMESIPDDKRMLPDPIIVGNTRTAIEYSISHDEIADMFANLLASAANLDKSNMVHPAFAEFIKQITPHEALILSEFYTISSGYMAIPIERIRCNFKFSASFERNPPKPVRIGDNDQCILLNDYIRAGSASEVGYIVNSNWQNLNIHAMAENLIRLGLISFRSFRIKNRGMKEKQFWNAISSYISAKSFENGEVVFELAHITKLGQDFVKTCVTKREM